MKFFREYLKMRLPFLGITAFTLFIFPVLNAFYGFPDDAVKYGCLLVAFMAAVYLLFDVNRNYKKHRFLEEKLKNVSIYETQLPGAFNLIEEDYQKLIDEIYNKTAAAFDENEMRSKDMMDYYMNWVHQIKTPISALYLLFQEAQEAGYSMNTFRQELFKVEQYVDMVLQYLRIDNVENDLALYEFSLNKVVKQTVKKYSTIFIHKKIKLCLSDCPAKVLSDEKWLALILEQLLSNALKYTSEGEIRIYQEPDQESEYRLTIEDTGIGIRREDRQRIFEKGFTGYNGRIGEKSSGLGLFLSKKVADKLHHKIVVESEVGKGTKMTVVFPKEKLELYS